MKSCGVTIQMKATEQYFPVEVFIMLHMYKVVMIFGSVKVFRYSFRRPYQYFSIALKVILSLSNHYKIFSTD